MSRFQPVGWGEEMRYYSDSALRSRVRLAGTGRRTHVDAADRAADMLALRAEGMDVLPPVRSRFRVNV